MPEKWTKINWIAMTALQNLCTSMGQGSQLIYYCFSPTNHIKLTALKWQNKQLNINAHLEIHNPAQKYTQ